MISLKYALAVYMLSASYDIFHRQFLRKCFNQYHVEVFRGIQEIINNIAPNEVQKQMKTFKKDDELLQTVKTQIISLVAKKPILIFVVPRAGENENLYDKNFSATPA